MGHGVGQNAVPLSGDGSHSRGGIQRQLGEDQHGAESQELPILHGHVQGRLVMPDANNWEQYSVVIVINFPDDQGLHQEVLATRKRALNFFV